MACKKKKSKLKTEDTKNSQNIEGKVVWEEKKQQIRKSSSRHQNLCLKKGKSMGKRSTLMWVGGAQQEKREQVLG